MENLTRSAVRALLASFQGKEVVVVGDVMLDEYVRGDAARISPEAPVPVVDLTERQLMPGGAANAAANIVSLGAKATIVGVVGADLQAEQLRAAMKERGIAEAAIVTAKERPTTHKLRIVARTQQIVRVDGESRERLSAESEAKLIAQITKSSASAHAIVISDYAKGVATDAVIKACIAAALAHGIPLVVDPKARDFSKYAGATIITPNLLELEVAAGLPTPNTDAAIVEAGRALLARVGGAQILVTRGAAGMTLLSPEAEPLHLPTVARSV